MISYLLTSIYNIQLHYTGFSHRFLAAKSASSWFSISITFLFSVMLFFISKYVTTEEATTCKTVRNVRVPVNGLVIFLTNLNITLGPSIRSGIRAVPYLCANCNIESTFIFICSFLFSFQTKHFKNFVDIYHQS